MVERSSTYTLNSSIMSWKGDHSVYYDDFYEDEDYSMIKYWRGIDEYLYKETECQLYERICWSFMYSTRGDALLHCLSLQSQLSQYDEKGAMGTKVFALRIGEKFGQDVEDYINSKIH